MAPPAEVGLLRFHMGPKVATQPFELALAIFLFCHSLKIVDTIVLSDLIFKLISLLHFKSKPHMQVY